MTDADFKAMKDLATELVFFEAVKFIRGQVGYGLREAYELAQFLGENNPETVLGGSVAKRNGALK